MINSHQRPTIAVLNDFMDLVETGYETQLRRGFEAACRHHDVNLLLVFGEGIDDTSSASGARSAIYESITSHTADGVILGSGLASLGRTANAAAWVARRPSLPVCCAGFSLTGVPSVVVDNRPGMRAVVEHLIREHGCRKLAYLGGVPDSPDAELRFEVYQAALREYGLEFDPIRVATGNFVRYLGKLAMLEILDRGAEIDGVVAANDGMALGAIAGAPQPRPAGAPGRAGDRLRRSARWRAWGIRR